MELQERITDYWNRRSPGFSAAVMDEITNGDGAHVQEAALLQTAAYRHALAEGIAEGVMAYKENLLRRQSAEFVLTPGRAGAM